MTENTVLGSYPQIELVVGKGDNSYIQNKLTDAWLVIGSVNTTSADEVASMCEELSLNKRDLLNLKDTQIGAIDMMRDAAEAEHNLASACMYVEDQDQAIIHYDNTEIYCKHISMALARLRLINECLKAQRKLERN